MTVLTHIPMDKPEKLIEFIAKTNLWVVLSDINIIFIYKVDINILL